MQLYNVFVLGREVDYSSCQPGGGYGVGRMAEQVHERGEPTRQLPPALQHGSPYLVPFPVLPVPREASPFSRLAVETRLMMLVNQQGSLSSRPSGFPSSGTAVRLMRLMRFSSLPRLSSNQQKPTPPQHQKVIMFPFCTVGYDTCFFFGYMVR